MKYSLKTSHIFVIGVLFAALVLGAACGDDAAGAVHIDESKDGQSVAMKSGGTLVVSLPSNPTTGYGWTVSDPTGGLEKQGESTFKPGSTTTPVVGGGGTEVLTFKAGAAGQYKLGLAYVRSFEPNAAPAEIFNVTVTVK